MGRTVAYKLLIAWDGASYTDETARLVNASGENRLTPPDQAGTSSKGIVDRCSLELSNHDGRFSALNTSGPLYAYIQNGKAYHMPVNLQVSLNGGAFANVFTGVIKLPQETTVTPSQTATVRIECRSKDELILQKRISTTVGNLQARTAYTEGQHIQAWLDDAGVTGYYVDGGVYQIPYGWLDDESVLEEIWSLAGACGGRFYADPDGNYRYEDATHWLKSPHNVSQETFGRGDFQNLAANFSDSDLYNVVTVEASSRTVGVTDTLWEPDEVVMVPPSTTKTMTARLRQAAWQIDAPSYKASTAGGLDITSSVTVTANNYVQRVELTITNAHATYAAYLRPFNLVGKGLTGGPTQEESRNSAAHGSNSAFWTAARGTRTKTIRGNAYVQSRAQAGSLALFLLQRSESPRLTWRLSGCAGKPGRRCGDRVTINDTATMSASRDAFITAISWRLSDSGFVQDIETIDATSLYPYATEYFTVGANKLGASGPLTARLFY